MNREEATTVIRELLGSCVKLDEVYLCMVPPKGDTPIVTLGYQIHIKATSDFDKEALECIENVAKKHNLTAQRITDQEKMVIYKEH